MNKFKEFIKKQTPSILDGLKIYFTLLVIGMVFAQGAVLYHLLTNLI